jgi:8-hydroxy-5-deazaflavin:NADPH oxidoreductase
MSSDLDRFPNPTPHRRRGDWRRLERCEGGTTVEIAVIGTGFIGGILGRSLARAGQRVTFGSRHPDDAAVVEDTKASVAAIADALLNAEVVILALPGAAVAEFTAEHADALAGKLVIDATNQMGAPVANARAALPATVRYVRAFNTLGGENMAEPDFADGPADLFFSAPEADRSTVETVISAVGLRPISLGADQEDLVDALFRVWIALAMQQGRGRRLALRVIDH